MKKNLLTGTLTLVLSASAIGVVAQTNLYDAFRTPQDTARTKVWWFHGETAATHEGITADLEAFRQQGVGGVVYYDQVHGNGAGAAPVFSPDWWDELLFSAQEAQRLGLQFEVNASNGYVAGGRWITPDCSMQRLECIEQVIDVTRPEGISQQLRAPVTRQRWFADVAVLAIPYSEQLFGDSRLLNATVSQPSDSVLTIDFGQPFTARSITYEATPQGKARTSSMQVPPTHQPLSQPDTSQFYGCGFRLLPDIGTLEVSDDGTDFQQVCSLRAKYQNLGGLRQQTIAFPAVTGRYFRIRLTAGPGIKVSHVVVSARACADAWEEKASLVSELMQADRTPIYNKVETIQPTDITDLTDKMAADGTLSWPDAPKGRWLVLRFVSVSTGGHAKHGRADALGLECDKLSTRGARLQWQQYVKPVIDSIRTHGARVQGLCMDSHEAGPQNWTVGFEHQFRKLRGYDLRHYLPVMAGFAVGSTEQSNQFLYDLRHTISDLITTEYYGEFNLLCHDEQLTLTAQAIGGALCMAGDAIEVKKLVDKPQGEFWGYQTQGNYDIKDCASAAHVYGKLIASGEAYTDITYKHSLADIKNLADYGYAYGINEMVVCAVAYQADAAGHTLNTANGRQYVLNRLNTLWPVSAPFWDWQARCSWLMRQGKPVSDLCVYLGDDIPVRLLGHEVARLPHGYDFDAFTTDVLLHRMTARNGRITLPDGVSYSALVLPFKGRLTEAARQQIDAFRHQGIVIIDPQDSLPVTDAIQQAHIQPDVESRNTQLYFAHRRTQQEDIYFLNNHSDQPLAERIIFKTTLPHAELWSPVDGQRRGLNAMQHDGRMAIDLQLAPRESFFVVFSQRKDKKTVRWEDGKTEHVATLTRPWQVQFDPQAGGPSSPVSFDTLSDWTHHEDPSIRYFSGVAVCQNSFLMGKKHKQANYIIQVPLANAAAEVIINGQSAGIVWCSPWEMDITPYVKKGKNQLQLRVANPLWNRLVGDANKTEADRIMLQTTPLAKPTDRLVPSGIIGTVKIDMKR